MNELVAFLIDILILGVVICAVQWFIGILALAPQIKQIALFVVGIIGLIFLLEHFTHYTAGSF